MKYAEERDGRAAWATVSKQMLSPKSGGAYTANPLAPPSPTSPSGTAYASPTLRQSDVEVVIDDGHRLSCPQGIRLDGRTLTMIADKQRLLRCWVPGHPDLDDHSVGS